MATPKTPWTRRPGAGQWEARTTPTQRPVNR
jgi:hypothetical protein